MNARRALPIAASLAALAVAWPEHAPNAATLVEIAPPTPGSPTTAYQMKCETKGGAMVTGTVNLKKIGGEMYTATRVVGGATQRLVCLRAGSDLSCARSDKTNVQLYTYLVQPPAMSGPSFSMGDLATGSETLTNTNPKSTFGGVYGVSGKSGGGQSYTGTAYVDMLPVASYALTIKWVLSGTTVVGVGLRNAQVGEPDLVSVAESTTGTVVAAMQLSISVDGKTLTGGFVEVPGTASLSQAKVGVETWTR